MSLDRLVKIEDRWDRLVEAARLHAEGDVLLDMIETVDTRVRLDISEQEARFAAYLPARPADEPHDAQCQVTRWGGEDPCTCKSNAMRRRQQVRNAARARDMAFRETLGSMEQRAFDDGVRSKIRCIGCNDGLNPDAQTDDKSNCLMCGVWVVPF